ncbi:MAG: hypothetical protein AAF569_02520 [Pseudomonadota bacterium]
MADGTSYSDAFTAGHDDTVRRPFDLGQDALTPEIIQNLYGESTVMINSEKSDYPQRMHEALSEATLTNGKPLNFSEEAIDNVIAEGSRLPVAMLGQSLEIGIILYMPSKLLRLNSPEGWNDYALNASDVAPESFSGILSHKHPTLMMNMSLMTEISHHQWYAAAQEKLQPEQYEEWLENPDNLNHPKYQELTEMGLDEEVAAINAIMEDQETDVIRMEIRGDADAVQWTTEWAEENNRPDIAEAAQDFIALRVAGPMTRWVSSLATSQNMRNGIEYSTEERDQAFMQQDDIKEDVVAGIGGLLEGSGMQITTMDDINTINTVILKAGAILTEVLAEDIDFAEGMPIDEALENGNAMQASIHDIHAVIAEIHRTGELPTLPDEVGTHILPSSEAEAAQIMDVLRAYGVAIERSMPEQIPQVITSDLGAGNWGIENADNHWGFDQQPENKNAGQLGNTPAPALPEQSMQQ